MVRVGFLIFGSFHLPKYQEELEDCYWKWGLAAHLLDDPVRFQTGQIPDVVPFQIESMLVQFMDDTKPSTQNDAPLKAAKHFFNGIDNTCDFYFVCTTDARIEVIDFHDAVRKFNPQKTIEIEDFQCENSVLLSQKKMREIVESSK